MQFCKDCGGALQLFGNDKDDLCSSCVQKKKRAHPQNTTALQQQDDGLLDHAVLTVENGRMVLRSKEGWELWSGTASASNNLKLITDRARRIYVIRLKRQKN